MMCKIAPNHVGMLRFLGSVFLMCAFVSIVSGKTYYKGVIIRSEEPLAFWIAVGAYLILGTFILLGTHICPIVG